MTHLAAACNEETVSRQSVEMKSRSRILLIDDAREFADMLRDQLSCRGYQVDVAYSGREGLARFEGGDYAMVITDLVMPDFSGMEVLLAAKKSKPASSVLIITGFGRIERAVEAIEKGAFDFVTKPFRLTELEAVIDRAFADQYTQKKRVWRRAAVLAVASLPLWILLGMRLWPLLAG